MTGVKEQTGALRARGAELVAEGRDRLLHLRLARVLRLDHIEADILQALCHQLGVVGGIGQRGQVALIGGVADHQGDARFRRRGPYGEREHTEQRGAHRAQHS